MLCVSVCLDGEEWTFRDTEICDPRYTEVDRERRVKERVRLGIRRVFERVYGLAPSPWGILSGVRPMKMVHSMLDRGFPRRSSRASCWRCMPSTPRKLTFCWR